MELLRAIIVFVAVCGAAYAILTLFPLRRSKPLPVRPPNAPSIDLSPPYKPTAPTTETPSMSKTKKRSRKPRPRY